MNEKSKEEMEKELPDLVQTIMKFKENKDYPESSLKNIKKMYKQLYSLDVIQAMGENVADKYNIKIMKNDSSKFGIKLNIFVFAQLGMLSFIPIIPSISMFVFTYYLYLMGVLLFNTFVVDKVLQNNFEKKAWNLTRKPNGRKKSNRGI